MRLLVEILIVSVLIYLGWDIPFRDRLPASITGAAKTTPAQTQSQPVAAPRQPDAGAAPRQPFTVAAPSPSGAWMWDPNHRGALDRPTQTPHRP